LLVILQNNKVHGTCIKIRANKSSYSIRRQSYQQKHTAFSVRQELDIYRY
jgi:hypothetical protein